MNASNTMIDLVKFLYVESEAIVITNDEKRKKFTTERGVIQGYPISPYLFITVLELMAIEMREDSKIKGINLATSTKSIMSFSHKEKQKCNKDDRISIFADDSLTMTTSVEQIKAAGENIFTCKKLHDRSSMKER